MRRTVLSVVIILISAPAWCQFVAPGGAIPVVANIPGESNTFWRSDVSIRNVSSAPTSVTLMLLPELRPAGPTFDRQISDAIMIPGNGQVTIQNVVTSLFGIRNKKGGLSVFSNDGAPVVLASRTYTTASTGGTYGTNVSGVLVSDTGWIANVEHDAFYRSNIGIFVPVDPQPGQPYVFTVTTYDPDGLQIAQGSVTFDQAGLQQLSIDKFGVGENLLDGSVIITCNDPLALWFGYATVVDEGVSQDSVFRAAIGRQPSAR